MKQKNKKIIKGKIKYPLKLEDYDRLEKLFNKMDKIWQAEFGKECPEFMPDCAQCKFALIYNQFKQKVYDSI